MVIHFELTDRPERYWVVIGPTGCSLCEADSGFDVDIVVHAELANLYSVSRRNATRRLITGPPG